MTNNIRASVAMAVYNGEKYLPEQLDSILTMLGPQDEIVISYDKSTDNTLRVITDYAQRDPRIRCVANEGKSGVSGNFTNAAANCRGAYIFFSDQDDVWVGDKINHMISVMEREKADLAIHDGYLSDMALKPYPKSLFELNGANVNPLLNFIKGRFLGCCMLFRKDAMHYVLPFPDNTSDFPHDIFAAILVEIKGKVCMTPEKFIFHRLHEGNATPKKRNRISKIIVSRWLLLRCIVRRLVKTYHRK